MMKMKKRKRVKDMECEKSSGRATEVKREESLGEGRVRSKVCAKRGR
jgi:hypothetical protein